MVTNTTDCPKKKKKNYYKAWQRLSSVFKGLKCDIVEEEIKTCINLRSKGFLDILIASWLRILGIIVSNFNLFSF